MIKLSNCISTPNDFRLLAVALLICAVSAATGVAGYRRAVRSGGGQRVGWTGFTGFVLGCGVWTTHFLSMLAYQDDLPIDYSFGLTALSLASAIAILGCGAFIGARSRTTLGRLAAGAVVGAGIEAMHFVGVAAMSVPLIRIWDRGALASAVAIGLIGGAAALATAGDASRLPRRWAAAGLLVATIAGLHFIAMAAITLVPGAGPVAASGPMRFDLALEVGIVAAVILTGAIGMLVVSRASAEAALHNLQSALDTAPTAIGFFDRDQRLTFWNRAYAELFQVFGLQPVRGLRFQTILARVEAAGMPLRTTPELHLAGAAAWGNPPDELELPDGRVIHAKIGPTLDGGLVAVLVDVTMTRQAEKLAQEARERAESANRLKSDFLANMSHEIRTPLNGVLGMAHVMEGHALDPPQRERLKIIMQSGETLLGLLNDLLDLAKVEAGKLELEDQPFDLEGTLRPTCEAFAATAALKQLSFDVTIAPSAAGQWRGDPKRLRQVVANLIANAVKFTPVGGVTVVIDRTTAGLRVCVSDTGVGMKAEQIPRLFEKFSQADSSATRAYGGTGLGLAICRDFTRLMRGEITVQSVEGVGSTFTLVAPLERIAGPLTAAPAPASRPSARGLRVLAAEDNEINRQVLTALLEPVDAQLVMTVDGEHALAAYRDGVFDVVLMDIQMPGMGGVEATRAIRAWEAEQGRARTPILAVTANLMTHHVGAYRAAGMDGVVAKPIEPAKLYEALAGVQPIRQAA